MPIDVLKSKKQIDIELNEHTKILMNSYQNNKIAIWTSHRIVQSQADETKRKLSEEKQRNKQLEARVRELQKDRIKTNFTDEQRTNIQSKEQKDDILKNLHMLMDTAKRQAQKATQEEKEKKEEKEKLKKEIKSFESQLSKFKKKDEFSKDHNQELRSANDALKTDIYKQIDTKKQELHKVKEDYNTAQTEGMSLQKAIKQYSKIIDERKRYIAYEYIKLNHADIQEMVDSLKNHFDIIKSTDLIQLSQENIKGEGYEG